MADYFIFRDHEGVIRSCIEISDKPSNFEKLIGLNLDPFIYRLTWLNKDQAEVHEYWWGTKVGMIIRVPGRMPITPYKSNKRLPGGYAASPTPFKTNNMK